MGPITKIGHTIYTLYLKRGQNHRMCYCSLFPIIKISRDHHRLRPDYFINFFYSNLLYLFITNIYIYIRHNMTTNKNWWREPICSFMVLNVSRRFCYPLSCTLFIIIIDVYKFYFCFNFVIFSNFVQHFNVVWCFWPIIFYGMIFYWLD